MRQVKSRQQIPIQKTMLNGMSDKEAKYNAMVYLSDRVQKYFSLLSPLLGDQLNGLSPNRL
jgi:hypothetical protein